MILILMNDSLLNEFLWVTYFDRFLPLTLSSPLSAVDYIKSRVLYITFEKLSKRIGAANQMM